MKNEKELMKKKSRKPEEENLTKKRTKLKIRDILIISYYHSNYFLELQRLKRSKRRNVQQNTNLFRKFILILKVRKNLFFRKTNLKSSRVKILFF